MLDRDRLARAFAKLRSERPSAWRDELAGDRHALLKDLTIRDLSALGVLLAEPGSLRDEEAEFSGRLWRRAALRRRLRLGRESCYGKPENAACECGERAFDALTDDELGLLNVMGARARVLKLAKERHKRAPRPRPRKPEPQLPANLSAAPPVAAAEAEHEPEQTKPESKPKPVLPRGGQEPEDPRSWSAFRRRRDGTHPQTAAEIVDTEF